jgi:hypothetical protein
MALVLADRVQQLGTANTTVSFTLSSTLSGYQSFAIIGNGNTTYYAAVDGPGNWEVGLGTYSTTGPTLTRTTILSSSNSGSAVTFSGTVTVFVTYPSEEAVVLGGTPTFSTVTTNASTTASSNVGAFNYGTLNFSDTGIVQALQTSVNSYFQNVIQNTSNGTQASAEFIVYNDQGTATTNYATVGINSSGYSGTGSINAAGYGFFLTASTDLVLGTIGNNSIHFAINSGATDALTINTSNAIAVNGSYGTSGQLLSTKGSTAAPAWQDPAYGTLYINLTNLNGGTASTIIWNPLYFNCGGAT